jgi:hypothetical protein
MMRFRLSKTAWLIIGIGVFIIVFGSLFASYLRLSGEQASLEDKLSSDQALLPQLTAQKADLTSQLARANSSLYSSIEYDEMFFSNAQKCGLEIANLTASEPADAVIEGTTFSATILKVEVRAAGPPPAPFTKEYISQNIANILAFINTIATDEHFNHATIDLVNIEAPAPEQEVEKPLATITLIIYSPKGK